MKIDERRKGIFLKVLAETGSISAAAAAATPHSKGLKPGYSGFRNLMLSDPAFAAQVEEAKTRALGMVEAEIRKRAFTPTKRPVFSKGELVGHYDEYRDANSLLLRIAERLSPNEWAQHRHHAVSGKVEHEHKHAVFALQVEHLDLLDEGDRNLLVGLLDRIAERQQQKELP